jgi:pimeloyl-ACP methyl ester carboxylesterase
MLQALEVCMPLIELSESKWSVREKGRGTNVVLVHGFPLDGRMWDDQLDGLSDRLRIIVPDLRGFGKSRSDKGFTIAQLAQELREVLRKLDGLPCVLVGLSMGGYVALEFARQFRSDLLGLVLVDTRADADSDERKLDRTKSAKEVRESGSSKLVEGMFPKLVWDGTIESKPAVAEKVRTLMNECPAKTVENALIAMRDRADSNPVLPFIDVPTLLLYGEHDAITPPPLGYNIAAKMPQAEMVVIRAAGHMAPMEQPYDVNRELRRFIERVSGTRGPVQ